MIKRIVIILTIIMGLFILIGVWSIHSWYNPHLYIKDFSSVAEDYDKVVDWLRNYYHSKDSNQEMIISIDSTEYTLSYEDVAIEMSDAVKHSLRELCETSYPGTYHSIRITDIDVSFWLNEAELYGIIYTKNLKETRKFLKRFDTRYTQLKRINSSYYEYREEHL